MRAIIETIKNPCLVSSKLFSNIRHTVVLKEIKGNKLYIADSLQGPVILSKKQFLATWIGDMTWIEKR